MNTVAIFVIVAALIILVALASLVAWFHCRRADRKTAKYTPKPGRNSAEVSNDQRDKLEGAIFGDSGSFQYNADKADSVSRQFDLYGKDV